MQASLAELNAVLAVARHRSFRAAARELVMSPSALSHAIAALEQRLGVRLFHRTTRSVAVTEAGTQLLARVRPALRELDEALAEAGDRRAEPAGTLRINAAAVVAQKVLWPHLAALVRAHPAIHVDLVTEERMVDIVAEGFDAGVRAHPDVPRDMIAVPITDDIRFAVVATRAYVKKHGTPRHPAELAQHACIRTRYTGGVEYRWDFEKRGKPLALDVRGPLTLDRADLMLEAALAGFGFAYLSELTCAKELAAGRLVRVLDDWTPAYPGLALYYAANRHVPAPLRALVDQLKRGAGR